MKRNWLTLFVIVLGSIVLAAWAGCGGDDEGETTSVAQDDSASTEASTTASSSGDQSEFEQRLADLEDVEATVTVIQDGVTEVIWSSKQGNWRWQDPNDESSYVIYNKDQDVIWIVDGDTAQELPGTGAEGMAWWGQNPAALITAFTEFSYGDIVDDVWEAQFPMGKITIELKGPEGLPSKMTVEQDDGTQVLEFEYTDVGSVPASLFELPAGVTAQQLPDIEGIENLGTGVPSL